MPEIALTRGEEGGGQTRPNLGVHGGGVGVGGGRGRRVGEDNWDSFNK